MTEARLTPFSNLLVVEASPGLEAALEELVTAFALHCRSQEDCLRFDCFQSCDAPGRFLLQAVWRDSESLALHLDSEPLREFFVKGAKLWRGSSVEGDYRGFTPME